MLSSSEAELSRKPAPYAWNAVLAYAASIGWGLQSGLTEQEYIEGKDLFRYSTALKNPAFTRGGPVTLPPWMGLPPDFIAGGAG